MTALISYPHLVLLLSLLLSLLAWAGLSKGFCLVARVALLLLCAENSAAIVDLMIGTAVASLPIGARIRHCRAALSSWGCSGAPQGFASQGLPTR